MPALTPFATLLARAVARHGGAAAVEARLPVALDTATLAAIPDHRWLSAACQCVFQAGFTWRVVEAKWPAFEARLDGFDLHAVAYLADDGLDELLRDKSLIRHHAKLRAARDNARFLLDLAAEHGTAAACFAAWPATDYVGLLALLKERGSRLGGTTGQYFLRRMGKESFILTNDVLRALAAEGVVNKAPGSRRDWAAVQAAFDHWRAESGRSLCVISRVLALGID